MFNRPPLLITTLLCVAVLLALSSCTLPGSTPPAPVDPNAVLTVAAQTIEAQVAATLTAAAPVSATDTPPGDVTGGESPLVDTPTVETQPETAPTETPQAEAVQPTATPTTTATPTSPPATPTPQPQVAQPTATPTPVRTLTGSGFSIRAVNITHCAGVATMIFQVANTGAEAFESAQVLVVDVAAGSTLAGPTSSDTPFRQSDRDCQASGARLASGGTGYVGAGLNASLPSGRLVRGTVMLCTQNGLSGRCAERAIDFTVP
jgi:outer membrane biosynthesis protein TonB